MKPFDLQAAMRGDLCITKSGKVARYLGTLKGVITYPLIFAIQQINEEGYDLFSQAGKASNFHDTDLDLFMLPKKKKLWIAISQEDYETSNFAYESEAELKEASCKARNGAWVVEVEVEE